MRISCSSHRGYLKNFCKMGKKLSFVLLALAVAVSVNAASIGDALVTIYAEPAAAVPESDAETVRVAREAEALGLKGHLHHHHHHHGSSEQYYSKPETCNKCGGGGGGPVATFAQSSAGTISGGGHGGGHGGFGGQSVSQSAAYNFGPFSASFSSSQSNGNGGFYGGFF